MWNLGDRVLALWPGDMTWWYPGVIVGTDGSDLELQFEDGDRSLVTSSNIVKLEFPRGANIHARIGRDLSYLPATVVRQQGSALLLRFAKELIVDAIEDIEVWTSVAMVRIDRAATEDWLRRN
jgi:hypothetical protein